MSRSKKVYPNGKPRGGTPGKATDTSQLARRSPKDYHRQMVAFHGGEMALERWVKGGRNGYPRN